MRLITRSDFDGLGCSTLLVALGLVDDWLFVHPKDVQDGKITGGDNDIVANVPYIPGCKLWFDHHSSEEERLGRTFTFEGASKSSPSACHVIYDYYGGPAKLGKYAEMVAAVDKMDSGRLTSDEILHPEGWVLLGFICDPRTGLGRIRNFRISNFDLMKELAKKYLDRPIEEILAMPDLKERVDCYKQEHELFIKMTKEHTRIRGNVIYSDLRGVDMHAGNRFLLYTLYPEQNVSVWVVDGKKGVNDVITCGYSIINKSCKADVGSLMLKYGGGGHHKVGTCQLDHDKADKAIEEIISALEEK